MTAINNQEKVSYRRRDPPMYNGMYEHFYDQHLELSATGFETRRQRFARRSKEKQYSPEVVVTYFA